MTCLVVKDNNSLFGCAYSCLLNACDSHTIGLAVEIFVTRKDSDLTSTLKNIRSLESS